MEGPGKLPVTPAVRERPLHEAVVPVQGEDIETAHGSPRACGRSRDQLAAERLPAAPRPPEVRPVPERVVRALGEDAHRAPRPRGGRRPRGQPTAERHPVVPAAVREPLVPEGEVLAPPEHVEASGPPGGGGRSGGEPAAQGLPGAPSHQIVSESLGVDLSAGHEWKAIDGRPWQAVRGARTLHEHGPRGRTTGTRIWRCPSKSAGPPGRPMASEGDMLTTTTTGVEGTGLAGSQSMKRRTTGRSGMVLSGIPQAANR